MHWRVLKSRVQQTTLVSGALIAFLAGLLFAKYGAQVSHYFTILGFLLAPLIFTQRLPALVAVMIIGFNIGLWRGEVTYESLRQYALLQNQEVTIIGSVLDDAVYEDRGQLEFHIGNIRHVGEAGETKLPGRVRIRSFTATGVQRGDIVYATGKLYEGFGSRQGSMSFAEVSLYGRKHNWLEIVRLRFFAGVHSALPDPQSSLGLGFLVGQRAILPESLTTALKVTGLTHIVAVSGYNLTILVRLARRLFARFSKYMAMAGSLMLITGFLAVTGMSPSVARAAIIAFIAMAAWYYGRPVKPIVLILFGAVVTAGINPLYLWGDLGWYLSFLAFIGVLVVAPTITKRFFRKKPKLVGQVLIETVSAQLLALPLIAFIFDEVSIVSVVANMLVLPLIPLAMLGTFTAGLCGMLIPAAAGWFAWPAKLLLTYIVDITYALSRIPWALEEININLPGMIFIYAGIAIFSLVLLDKSRQRLNAVEAIE